LNTPKQLKIKEIEMKQDIFPIARQRDIVVQESSNEVLVYDLKTNKVFCLNETSAIVWGLCDGQNDFHSIATKLQNKSNEQIPVELIEIALDQLEQENLLENYQTPPALTDKKSRREMIRKVGLATVIALPIITSLVAPKAINAQSACVGPTTQVCAVGVGACQRFGTQTRTCVGGVFTPFSPCSASPGLPSPEIPGDGIDNNCNGQVDE
jgi:Coenzyme PQQ synthesis protein D (PqqD)/Putative metal-binding motif